MSNKEKLPKLVDVYRPTNPLGRRQLPLVVDENLTLVMDVKSSGIICDNQMLRGKELEEFACKWSVLSPTELHNALQITKSELMHVLNQNVPCVGCRRSVDRLYYQLHKFGHPTLDPLVVKKDGTISINEDKQAYQIVGSIFHGHAVRLDKLIENQPKRNKKSVRCLLHSLDSQRSRPLTPVWRDVWDCMRPDCKKDVCIIEATSLHSTLETYLRKHRFCGECRTKVLKAYSLLVEEPEPTKEKGYIASLYAGIKRCLPNKHIHLQAKTDYITKLISRAEPELLGRERHAKTLEIAQEEVLTCLGICMYERLHRIYMRMREEECTCQVFAAVAVHTLSRSFETAVEKIRGVSQLELLYAEFAREEQQKQLRREQKKIKRKKKKVKSLDQDDKVGAGTTTCNDCLSSMDPDDYDEEDCSCSNISLNDVVQHHHSNQKCDDCFTCEQVLQKKKNKLLLHRHGGGGNHHHEAEEDEEDDDEQRMSKTSTTAGRGRKKKHHHLNDENDDEEEEEEEDDDDDDDDEDFEDEDVGQHDDGLQTRCSTTDEDTIWSDECKCNNNNAAGGDNNIMMATSTQTITTTKDNRRVAAGKGINNVGGGGGINASCKCDTRSLMPSTYFGDFANHHHQHHHNNNHGTKKDGGGSSSSEHSSSHDCGYSSENNNGSSGGGGGGGIGNNVGNGGCCGSGSINSIAGSSGGGGNGSIISSSLSTSPEGSEVACSDTCCQHDNNDMNDNYNNSATVAGTAVMQQHHCRLSSTSYGSNHGGNGLSLQEMLECHCDEDDDECYITAEEVREFKNNSRQVHEKRLELREMLQKRFAQFCVNGPVVTVPRLLLQTKYASN